MVKRFACRAAVSLAAALLFVAAGSGQVWGYGNFMATQGARATGMGWCTVAKPTDASAIFFNPAAMSTLKGLQIYGGGSFYFADVKYDPGALDPGAGPDKAHLGLFFLSIETMPGRCRRPGSPWRFDRPGGCWGHNARGSRSGPRSPSGEYAPG